MNAVLLEVLVIGALVLLNGVLAMSEIAVVAARRAHLSTLAEQGDRDAERALGLAEHPGTMLSTVQIGITLVGILTGVFSGATLARWLSLQIGRVDMLAPYAQPIAAALVVVALSYLMLVFGEITPKRVGLARAERTAMRVAPAMLAAARVAAPVVRLLDRSSALLLRLLRIGPRPEPSVTDEEVRSMLALGTRVGVFEPIEGEIVEQVFRMSDRTVAALQTPRTDIVWVEPDAGLAELQEAVETSGHSRFPVATDDLDNVVGVVTVKDLFASGLGKLATTRGAMREPLYIPESMPAFSLLERFRQSGDKIALVVDEYGGVSGLVTSGDLVEAIVGDLPDPDEPVEELVLRRDDGTWLVDGMLPLDEFCARFHVPPDDDVQRSQTVGGLVMSVLGRVPSSGERFTWHGLEVEVMDMDGRRVDKVLVTTDGHALGS